MATGDDQKPDETPSRRSLLTTIGSLSVVGFGAPGLAAGKGEESTVRTLRGRDRAQVLRIAARSDMLRNLRRRFRMGFRPRKVFEFEHDSNECRGVIFEATRDAVEIKYYTSNSFIGERAFALVPEGDGIRSIDPVNEQTVEIDTPRAFRIRSMIEDEVDHSSWHGTVPQNGILLTDTSRDIETYRTILQKSGERVGRIGFRIAEQGDRLRIDDQDVIYDTDEVSTLGHKGCVFGWCTDGCQVLCSALGGASNVGCRSACVYSGAGLILQAACGQVCQAITHGVCYPSCKAVVH